MKNSEVIKILEKNPDDDCIIKVATYDIMLLNMHCRVLIK